MIKLYLNCIASFGPFSSDEASPCSSASSSEFGPAVNNVDISRRVNSTVTVTNAPAVIFPASPSSSPNTSHRNATFNNGNCPKKFKTSVYCSSVNVRNICRRSYSSNSANCCNERILRFTIDKMSQHILGNMWQL
ncbi:hypothetical protein BLOT_011406 [Blomia tropicalis]|nr:hypothetical protein BLOT_011406 [Blomia tropicalis]